MSLRHLSRRLAKLQGSLGTPLPADLEALRATLKEAVAALGGDTRDLAERLRRQREMQILKLVRCWQSDGHDRPEASPLEEALDALAGVLARVEDRGPAPAWMPAELLAVARSKNDAKRQILSMSSEEREKAIRDLLTKAGVAFVASGTP